MDLDTVGDSDSGWRDGPKVTKVHRCLPVVLSQRHKNSTLHPEFQTGFDRPCKLRVLHSSGSQKSCAIIKGLRWSTALLKTPQSHWDLVQRAALAEKLHSDHIRRHQSLLIGNLKCSCVRACVSECERHFQTPVWVLDLENEGILGKEEHFSLL